ncbi:hypothetical protein EYS14_16965 [Alteromonadaceae bacterium M269]|nr:hypothetical protein EYS14_16965 [Alteromonadaceae bacterium M269]
MKLKELYEFAIAKWPSEIDISDGVCSGKEVYLFSELNRLYEGIASNVERSNDWESLACWAFHQALWDKATVCYEKGVDKIKAPSISPIEFDRLLRNNLMDDGWSEERIVYEKANPT